MRAHSHRLIRATVIAAALALAAAPLGARAAADVALDLKVERKPYTLFQGQPRPVHELVRAIARRGQAGQTTASIRTDYPGYRVLGEREEPDGAYRIVPGSLALLGPSAVRVRMSIEYPKLSETQVKALRGKKDYRLLYGFIRGIVEHEELHAREFVRYARMVRTIVASTPIGENPVARPREGETVGAALARYVNDRIREAMDAARGRSTAAQDALDETGAVTRVTFRFTEPVSGKVPDPSAYATRAKLQVTFDVPKGTPRPPEPKTRY